MPPLSMIFLSRLSAFSTGSPFFSLFWYEALAGTRTYPGESVWRALGTAPPAPFAFVVGHPAEVVRKVAVGVVRFREEALNTVDPVVGFLFLAALLSGQEGWKWRRLLASIAGGLLLFAALSCVLRADPSLLLAWAPLLAIIAAGRCTAWLHANVSRVALRQFTVRRAWLLRGAYAALLATAVAPLVVFLGFPPPRDPVDREARLAPVRRLLPPDARVLTDQPALVAWYGQREGIWLCQEESSLDALERALGPIDAAYVTSGLARVPPEERGAWWVWLAAPVGVYRGLAPAELALRDGVLRVRQTGPRRGE